MHEHDLSTPSGRIALDPDRRGRRKHWAWFASWSPMSERLRTPVRRLRGWRQRRNLSQLDLASRADVDAAVEYGAVERVSAGQYL